MFWVAAELGSDEGVVDEELAFSPPHAARLSGSQGDEHGGCDALFHGFSFESMEGYPESLAGWLKLGKTPCVKSGLPPCALRPFARKAGVYAWQKMGGVTMKAAPPGIADMVSDRSLSGAPVEAAEVVQRLAMV